MLVCLDLLIGELKVSIYTSYTLLHSAMLCYAVLCEAKDFASVKCETWTSYCIRLRIKWVNGRGRLSTFRFRIKCKRNVCSLSLSQWWKHRNWHVEYINWNQLYIRTQHTHTQTHIRSAGIQFRAHRHGVWFFCRYIRSVAAKIQFNFILEAIHID